MSLILGAHPSDDYHQSSNKLGLVSYLGLIPLMIIICLVIIGMSLILVAHPSDDYHLSSNKLGLYCLILGAHPSDDYHQSSNKLGLVSYLWLIPLMIIICLAIIGMSLILGAHPSDDYHLSSNNWDESHTWGSSL